MSQRPSGSAISRWRCASEETLPLRPAETSASARQIRYRIAPAREADGDEAGAAGDVIPGPIILPRLMPRDGAADRIARIVKALPMDVAIRVEFHEHKPKRSDQQNRYLWGVVYPTIIKEANLEGWTAEEVHEWCLGEWSGWEELKGLGRTKVRPVRRSSRLSKLEFADYVADIQRRMAERGIFIPDPDPEWMLKEQAA